jgi:hypothetical protein
MSVLLCVEHSEKRLENNSTEVWHLRILSHCVNILIKARTCKLFGLLKASKLDQTSLQFHHQRQLLLKKREIHSKQQEEQFKEKKISFKKKIAFFVLQKEDFMCLFNTSQRRIPIIALYWLGICVLWVSCHSM